MSGHMIIKLPYESPTNSCTFLIDGVKQRISYILNTLQSPFRKT